MFDLGAQQIASILVLLLRELNGFISPRHLCFGVCLDHDLRLKQGAIHKLSLPHYWLSIVFHVHNPSFPDKNQP